MEKIKGGFSQEDIEQGVEILRKWQGVIPTPLFTEIAKMVVTPVIETVILRLNEGEIEILLIPRPVNDIVWKGMIHSPGGALRPTDFDREDEKPNYGVFERIEKHEIGTKFTSLTYVGLFVPGRKSARGAELPQVYLASIDNNAKLPEGVDWYDVADLPNISNFIHGQMTAINMAVAEFKKINNL